MQVNNSVLWTIAIIIAIALMLILIAERVDL